MTLTLDSKQESSSPNPAGIIGSMGCAGSILWRSQVIMFRERKKHYNLALPDYNIGFPKGSKHLVLPGHNFSGKKKNIINWHSQIIKGSKHYNLVLPGYNVLQKGSSIYYQDLIKLSAGLRLTRGKSLK